MSREAASLALAQEREDAALEARQAEAFEEVADGLWANEPDPYVRYDTDPVPLSRALDDTVANLRARQDGEAAVVVLAVLGLIAAAGIVLAVAADAGSILVGLVVLLAVAGVVAAMACDTARRRDGRR